jgi:hypothetical protein
MDSWFYFTHYIVILSFTLGLMALFYYELLLVDICFLLHFFGKNANRKKKEEYVKYKKIGTIFKM